MNSSATNEEGVRINKRKRKFVQTKETSFKKNGNERDSSLVQENNGRSHLDAKKSREEIESCCFSLELFSDEVLYEIFKHLDTWSLMTLML